MAQGRKKQLVGLVVTAGFRPDRHGALILEETLPEEPPIRVSRPGHEAWATLRKPQAQSQADGAVDPWVFADAVRQFHVVRSVGTLPNGMNVGQWPLPPRSAPASSSRLFLCAELGCPDRWITNRRSKEEQDEEVDPDRDAGGSRRLRLERVCRLRRIRAAPNWHVHDGQTTLGPQHKPVSFFPAILAQPLTDYLADPARCPDATDKSLLPSSGESESDLLRAGVCMTSTTIIQLRTVPIGTSGPEGWQTRIGPEAGYVTYYSLTPR